MKNLSSFFQNNIDVYRNIFWLFVDKILFILLNFLLLIKIANYYGKFDFGLYQYAFNVNLILSFLIRCIDGNVVKKYLSVKDESNVFFHASFLRIILSIFSFGIGLIFLSFINKGNTFNYLYFLILLNTLIDNISFGVMIFFEYKLQSKKFVVSSNIGILIGLVFQLLAIRNNMPIISVGFSLLLASSIKVIILLYQFFKFYKLKFPIYLDKKLIFNFIKESFPLSIYLTSFLIFMRIDQVMLGNMLSLNEVGLYSLSVQMVQVTTLIIKPIQVSVFPKMVNDFSINKINYFKKFIFITSVSTYLFIFLSILVLIISPFIFDKFIDSQYNQSLYFFQFLLLGTFFLYNSILSHNHFVIIKETQIIMYTSIFAALMNIVLNLFLIPILQVRGAVFSTIISQFCATSLFYLFFQSSRKIFYLQIKAINPKVLIQYFLKKNIIYSK